MESNVKKTANAINAENAKEANNDFLYLKDINSNEEIKKAGFTELTINLEKVESKKKKGNYHFVINFVLHPTLTLSLSSTNSQSKFTEANYYVICAERKRDFERNNTHTFKGFVRLSKSEREDGSTYVVAEIIASNSNRFKVFLSDMQIRQINAIPALKQSYTIYERPASDLNEEEISSQIFGE